MGSEPRDVLVAFRVTPTERRELALLAKAEQTNASELIRRLLRNAASDSAQGWSRKPPRTSRPEERDS